MTVRQTSLEAYNDPYCGNMRLQDKEVLYSAALYVQNELGDFTDMEVREQLSIQGMRWEMGRVSARRNDLIKLKVCEKSSLRNSILSTGQSHRKHISWRISKNM